MACAAAPQTKRQQPAFRNTSVDALCPLVLHREAIRRLDDKARDKWTGFAACERKHIAVAAVSGWSKSMVPREHGVGIAK